MSNYRERLERVADRYKLIQRKHPSRAWGPVEDGHANIPNTAEVLAVLRCAKEPYESFSVQEGVRYLASRVLTHPRPMDRKGGRWPLTRFLVYGLVGLTQWPEWVNDERLRESSRLDEPTSVRAAVDHCVEWLAENRVDAGWPDRADKPACSVLQTATAIIALSRAGKLPDEVAEARTLLAERQSRHDGSWPELVSRQAYRGREGSPAHTALAVLALCDGDATHRMHAERGRDWLLKYPDKWRAATHSEKHATVEPWLHMTFALGLRACLRAGADPLSPVLRPVVGFLDGLWVDRGPEADQWQDGQEQTATATVHASHGVVMAYEQLRKSQRHVDPIVFFRLVEAGSAAATSVKEHYRLHLGLDNQMVTIIDMRSGERFPPVALGRQSWGLVRALADLQYGGDAHRDSVGFDELSVHSKDVGAMLGRINRQVRQATDRRLEKLILVPNGSKTCALAVRLADTA